MTDEEFIEPGEACIGCVHSSTESRIWTLSNGAKQIILQCTVCGDTVGGAISRSKFGPDALTALPPLDRDLQERTREQRKLHHAKSAERFQIKRVQHTQQYYDYLKTDKWREKRNAVMKRDKHICQGCLCTPAAHVHHLTYDHVFDELLFELVAVCVPCHEKIHATEGGKRQ